jgi:two-component system chemotaxis response regulator CheB
LSNKIKVLIVDDSAVVRKILSEAVSAQNDMEVVGTAPDPYVARDKILALQPDVLTLDIEMPRMDGLTFLKRVMRYHPVPTIIISSLGQASTAAALDALRSGAVEVLAKPAGPYSIGDLRYSLANRIRAAAAARPRLQAHFAEPSAPAPASAPPQAQQSSALAGAPHLTFPPETLFAIGASTGGTIAIQDILQHLPADIPATVITQHIPAGFSLAFANRLNQVCSMEVREAVDGDIPRRGLVLVAPGDFHLLLRRTPSGYRVELQQGPQVCYQRPSVDVMFASVAQAAGAHARGVLLTGMGADGAKGLLAMKRAGAATIAQDEASCIVYGMPREAARLGAASTVAALQDIPRIMLQSLQAGDASRTPPPQSNAFASAHTSHSR